MRRKATAPRAVLTELVPNRGLVRSKSPAYLVPFLLDSSQFAQAIVALLGQIVDLEPF